MTTETTRPQPVTTEPANNTFVVWYDPYREPYAVYFRSDANGEDECRWFNADQHHSGGTEPSEWDELHDELLGHDGPHLLVPSTELNAARAEIAALTAANQRLLDRLHNATPDLVTAQQRADQAEDRATDLANRLHHAEQEIASHGKAVTHWANQVHQLQQIANAAAYEVGGMLCLDGECDHEIEDENAPCPFVETRHATAAELLAVKSLLISSDGDPLDDAEEIPVGEIRRVVDEARAKAEVA